ncbi:MAG TPA: cupredoxin family copper-binding protein [Vicinamibacterales bacterium]|nr:cupredoxin family copper-binding protein [Vicinamibacterales bacterium]
MKNRIVGYVAWAATGLMMTLATGALTGTPIAVTAHGAEHGAGGMRVVRIGDAPPGDDTPAAAADSKQVVVDNFSFTPATAAVPVGTTVTWTNHDDIPHNVVSPEQKFKSPVLDTNETFSHTFAAAGTYKYYCSIHPRMTGQVVVR